MANYGLTKEKLEAQIATVDYQRYGSTGTLCVITLVNGYTVTGESGCIDPTVFNEQMGVTVAYDNAFNKLWGILGYVEKQRWYEETQWTYKERLAYELAQLDEKRAKLATFLEQDRPAHIAEAEWARLKKQDEVMSAYALILQDRLAYAK